MPKLLIPDIDPATIALLRERARRHAHSVETEAKAILAEALQPSSTDPADPWAAVNAMREELARCGREFPDSTPLLREDRDR
jgi:plasmid stability protein